MSEAEYGKGSVDLYAAERVVPTENSVLFDSVGFSCPRALVFAG